MTRAVRAGAALLLVGCAARAAAPRVAPALGRLSLDLDSTFAAPAFARAEWGVVVESLDNGDVLYSRNAEKLFMPASNLKLLTSAVALTRLGAGFQFATTVLAVGERRADTLDGDLVVVGRGDPSLSLHATGGADVLAALRPWADSLRAHGIAVITGHVVGDASYFPDPVLGQGWMWDDLAESYSAPIGALQFNEGFALVTVTPGARAGDPAAVRLEPADAPLRVSSTVTTAPADSAIDAVDETRVFYTDSVPLRGRLSVGHAPLNFEVAVRDPTLYFERALGQALGDAGVVVLGTLPRGTAPLLFAPDTLFTWRSPPLDSIVTLLLKPSQNQIAEALLRALGSLKGQAGVDSGRAVVQQTLAGWGVPDDAYVLADGSGLSRYDYVAPSAIARTLVAMAHAPDFAAFYTALPIAGVDGSIATRMRGTAAQGNAHAKTGSIANVRTLSGYVTTADGERLVFVLMANGFTAPSRVVYAAMDHVVERLATLRRAAR